MCIIFIFSLADDDCNIAVESFQTLSLFRVNRSCYIHPSEHMYMYYYDMIKKYSLKMKRYKQILLYVVSTMPSIYNWCDRWHVKSVIKKLIVSVQNFWYAPCTLYIVRYMIMSNTQLRDSYSITIYSLSRYVKRIRNLNTSYEKELFRCFLIF